jgi:hypothetical protein
MRVTIETEEEVTTVTTDRADTDATTTDGAATGEPDPFDRSTAHDAGGPPQELLEPPSDRPDESVNDGTSDDPFDRSTARDAGGPARELIDPTARESTDTTAGESDSGPAGESWPVSGPQSTEDIHSGGAFQNPDRDD